jgi:hypothetical protein
MFIKTDALISYYYILYINPDITSIHFLMRLTKRILISYVIFIMPNQWVQNAIYQRIH